MCAQFLEKDCKKVKRINVYFSGFSALFYFNFPFLNIQCYSYIALQCAPTSLLY